MTFAPAVERPWRDAWPLPAQTDDANGWVTGGCWLYCRREGVRVLWIGSVHTPGATGDMYACGSCIAELVHMVRVQCHVRDVPADRVRTAAHAAHALPAHGPGRHRAPRRTLYRSLTALPVRRTR